MATGNKAHKSTVGNPIVWAIAIVIVVVGCAYAYSVVTRCQTSTFSALKAISISLGQCEVPTPPTKDQVPPAQPIVPSVSRKVTRSDMPCRWAWVYLGKYSPQKNGYLFPPAFRFVDGRGPSSPFPNVGDQIAITTDKTLIVTGYGSAAKEQQCASMLDPPWGYSPQTASKFEAGTLKKDSEVAVNMVTLMPKSGTEPTYVWALVGPEQ